MNKLFAAAFVLLVACASTLAAQPAEQTGDAKADAVRSLVESTVTKVLGYLKDADLDQEEKKEKVLEAGEPFFDFALMGKLVLGPQHWPQLNDTQREEYLRLFVKQLQDSFFDKVDLLSDETVEFGEPQRHQNKVHVPTYLLSKGERHEILYKLHENNDVWKVYDVEIEGVSFVKTYKTHYSRFLSKAVLPAVFNEARFIKYLLSSFACLMARKDRPWRTMPCFDFYLASGVKLIVPDILEECKGQPASSDIGQVTSFPDG